MAAGIMENRESLNHEMRVAVAATSMGVAGNARKIRLNDSDVPSLAPSESVLEVQPVKFTELKMGDLICVRDGNTFNVRRFVKVKMAKSDTYLLTAREGFDKKEALPRNSLMGRVESVTHRGQSFNPMATESFMKKFFGKLTEYGTHKPFGIFSAK